MVMQVQNDYLVMTDKINKLESQLTASEAELGAAKRKIEELEFQVRQEKHKGEVNANALLTRIEELESLLKRAYNGDFWRVDYSEYMIRKALEDK